jgi:hypothetical protein
MIRDSMRTRTWSTVQLARAGGVTPVRIRQLCETGRLGATRTPEGRWVIPDTGADAFLKARRARTRAAEAMASIVAEPGAASA